MNFKKEKMDKLLLYMLDNDIVNMSEYDFWYDEDMIEYEHKELLLKETLKFAEVHNDKWVVEFVNELLDNSNPMNFMDMYNACECKANKGLECLKEYLRTQENLMWTETTNDNIITIEVEYFIDDDKVCTDMLGVFEFNLKGRCIE